MTRILLTGARGFIGRHTAEALAARGADIVAVGRGARPASLPREAEWRDIDLLSCPRLEADVAALRADTLVHLAWETTHGRFWADLANLDWLAASARLLRGVLEGGGRRIVGVGTGAEYVPPPTGPCREGETPLAGAPLYAVAKDAFRRVAEAAARDTGASVAWGRVFLLYGPHETPQRLVPSVARALLAGEPANCSSGRQMRDFLDVRDCGSAIAALAMSEVAGPVNIASGAPVSIAEVAQTIGRLTGHPELVRLGALPDRAGEPPNLWGANGRLAADVGFRPSRTLEQGLREAVDWWAGQAR